MHRQCEQGVDLDLAQLIVARIFVGATFAWCTGGGPRIDRSFGSLDEVPEHGHAPLAG